jgi:hypothetical protein
MAKVAARNAVLIASFQKKASVLPDLALARIRADSGNF